MVITKRKMQLFLGTALAILTGSSMALTVSDIELNSYLNQKLDAQMQLGSVSTRELETLAVTISSINEQGFTGQQLQHEILTTEPGSIIKISSPELIKEPLLGFQIDINWQQGHLLRDYTLLIDPPGN